MEFSLREVADRKAKAWSFACREFIRQPNGIYAEAARDCLVRGGFTPREVASITANDAFLMAPAPMQTAMRLISQAVIYSRANVIPCIGDRLPVIVIDPSTYVSAWGTDRAFSGGVLASDGSVGIGRASIPISRLVGSVIEVTRQLIDDAGVDLEAFLGRAIGQAYVAKYETAFATGTGADGEPVGLFSDPAIPTVKSGAPEALTVGGVRDLWAALPAVFKANATFFMNSTTWGTLLGLDGVNSFALMPTTNPPTLFTRPVAITEFAPDIEAGATPIVVGDLGLSYTIADRQELRIARLAERFAPNVGIFPIARIGAQVVLPNAFRSQVVSQ